MGDSLGGSGGMEGAIPSSFSDDQLEMIKQLAARGQVMIEGPDGRLPLHLACGSVDAARLLLSHEPERQVMHADHMGRLPLHWICYQSDQSTEVVQMLLQHNPRQQILHVVTRGQIALHIACRRSSEHTIRLMLECEAYPV